MVKVLILGGTGDASKLAMKAATIESKAELIANNRGIPFLSLQGRRGGSAIAAAAVNALAIEEN